MSKFIPLHVHSHYSLLEALPKAKDLIARAKEQGLDSLAVTDNGNMYGVIEFYKACKKEEIKPIIGMDAYLAPNGMLQKRGRIDAKPYRLTLLCETTEGYKNLIKLSSQGFLEGFYYKPRIDKELIRQYSKGLIALSGGLKGEIPMTLHDKGPEPCKEMIQEYLDIFGKDNFFIELPHHPEAPDQVAMNEQLIEIAKEMGVQMVATKNVFYLDPDDREAWKILNCVRDGKTLEDFDRFAQVEYDLSFPPKGYMEEEFKDLPEAIENTKKIADRCNIDIEIGVWHFPPVELPEGYDADSLLRERAFEEIKGKVDEVNQEVIDRIEYELDIIKVKEYSGYFLSVSDYTKWARDNDVVTTTRGSAAGSMVSYAVGISSINPLTYQIPFERFLNPERPSAPDVDADFADNQRDRVLKYVTEKYGKDHVAQICTFGTMLARGSVRDTGRALGFEYGVVDKIAKEVPMGAQGRPMTLEKAMEENPDLKMMYNSDADVKRIIQLAQRIEGCARHVSVHAAGVVISPKELTDYTPLQIDNREGKVITQYEMHAVEDAGLVKMDFLGIRNLSILGDAVKIVSKTKGVKVDLDTIPVDDQTTFDLLAKGYTMGVFQLSGDGMTKYLVELKPSRIEDIMAMVALYRPGPIEFIPEYIKRRFNPELIDYPHEDLKEILEKSLGLLIYQDDVMLTAIKLAGYSWLEADLFRKAMGKKIPELMKEQEKKFMDGCVANNISKSLVKDLWNRIKPFAMYAFNKAHASSYGMVAYQTAYMKANYPSEYMASLMTAEAGNFEKIADAVNECERMGIAVLPPDINESLRDFTYIDDKTIRFGLLTIKNLGEDIIETIIKERKENGQFKDLIDLAKRIHSKNFNKKSLEALVQSGAMDKFGERNQMLANMDRILLFNKQIQKEIENNQASLFELNPDMAQHSLSLREVTPATKKEKLAWEKELLGLYVSAHPFSDFTESFQKYLVPASTMVDVEEGRFIKVGGVVADCREIVTKKGDPMAFVRLEDTTGSVDMVVFPRVFKEFENLLTVDQLVLVSGKVSAKDGELSLMANSVISLDEDKIDELVNMLAGGMWITDSAVTDTSSSEIAPPPPSEESISIKLADKPEQEIVESLRELFMANPGNSRVFLVVNSAGKEHRVETDYQVTRSQEVVEQIGNIVGQDNISF